MDIKNLRINEITKNTIRQEYGIDIAMGFDNVLESVSTLHPPKSPFFLPCHFACEVKQDNGYLKVASEAMPDTLAGQCAFVFTLEFGSGAHVPQPTGSYKISVNDVASINICTQHSPCEWEAENLKVFYIPEYTHNATQREVLLGCENENISQGVLIILVQSHILSNGTPVTFEFFGQGIPGSCRLLRLFKVRPVLLKISEYVPFLFKGLRKSGAMGKRIFWGDIHNHSAEIKGGELHGCGTGTAEDNYRYAKDISRLDFYALTEHDYQIKDQDGWLHWETLSKKYNKNGKFITLPSFEWTSKDYGHRNVHYVTEGGAFFSSRDKNFELPEDVWRCLHNSNIKGLTIPHHPSAAPHSFDWNSFNPEFDRLIEIYSSWGSSEKERDKLAGFGTQRVSGLSIYNALIKGLEFGLIGSSDGHDGHPGNSQSPDNKHHHLYHTNGSGRVAVLTDCLDRESVFNALYHRRCYATTGAHIDLDFSLNGKFMGSAVPVAKDGQYLLESELHGTARLKNLLIISSRGVIQRIELDGITSMIQELIKLSPEDKFIYLKCQQDDNATAWSSPVWIKSAQQKG